MQVQELDGKWMANFIGNLKKKQTLISSVGEKMQMGKQTNIQIHSHRSSLNSLEAEWRQTAMVWLNIHSEPVSLDSFSSRKYHDN